MHHRSHLSCGELIHRAWDRLLTPGWGGDGGKGTLLLRDVINRAEGFAWDGAICFLFFPIFFFREAEIFFLESPSEAAGDDLMKTKWQCLKDNTDVMYSLNLCSPRGNKQLPGWV